MDAHADELVGIGIPREVWSDEMSWWRFLDHGHHPSPDNPREVWFDLSRLGDDQLRHLFDFLTTITPPDRRAGVFVWELLAPKFGRPAAPASRHDDS